MTDVTTLIKEFSHKKFTLKGRIFHPCLFVPKKTDNGREVFDVMFAFATAGNEKVLQEINAHLGTGMAAHAGFNPAALINPIKKYETYIRQDGRPSPDYLKGHMWVNASTGKDYPAPVVKNGPMGLINLTANDQAEVYSGRNAVVSISFYIQVPKPGAANQKRGFGVNVNGVMIMEGGDREGGAAGIDINQVFGSFAQESVPAQAFNPFQGQAQGAAQQQVQHTQQAPMPGNYQQAPINQQQQPYNPNGGFNGGGFI